MLLYGFIPTCRSYGPAHILRLSFRERKKKQQQQQHQQQLDIDKLQNRQRPLVQPPSKYEHKAPVTMETAPPTNNTTGDDNTTTTVCVYSVV